MSKIPIASLDKKSIYFEDVVKICDHLGIVRPARDDLAFSWIIDCIETGYAFVEDEDPDYLDEDIDDEADRLVPIFDFERAMVWTELQQYKEVNPGGDYIQAFSQRLYNIAYDIIIETQSGVLVSNYRD